MSRWSLLKSALVTRERDCSNAQSIHRFTGYNVVAKKKTLWLGFRLSLSSRAVESIEWFQLTCNDYMVTIDTSEVMVTISISDNTQVNPVMEEILALSNVRLHTRSNSEITLYVKHCDLISSLAQCEYWRYTATTASGAEVQLCTREKPRTGGLNVQSLLSNKLHGVDNTGNVCVWPAEPLLLHVLLTVPGYTSMVRGRRVLEIGGGMTALAGLGLAATGLAASVVVTDGHPDCVKNQRVCIAMTRQHQQQEQSKDSVAGTPGVATACTAPPPSPVAAQLLHWSPAANTAHIDSLNNGGTELFDVIIASDCLFFRDFHADLLETLRRLLKPGTGVGVFLQPSRDETMQKFVDRCAETGYFAAELQEDYCPEVVSLRRGYLARQEELGYAEDVHYPQMLLLRPLY